MNRKIRIEGDLQPRYVHYDPEMRLRIMYMSEHDDLPPEDVAKAFGISVRTIQNWRRAYDEKGMAGLEDSPKSGRTPFISKEEMRKCRESVQEKDGIATLEGIRKEIIDRHNVTYSENAIWKALDRMGITYKKAEPVHARAATNEEIEEWCRENVPIIDRCRPRRYVLMSQDEAHMHLDNDTRHGYAQKGERLYHTYQGKRQKVSIMGAIGTNGKAVYRAFSTASPDTFTKFLQAALRVVPRIVMPVDGASYHVSKKVRRWLDAHREIAVIRLPVGSPHMNSIENVWGKAESSPGRSTYYETTKFKKDALKFLRSFKFSTQAIRGKLNSRLDPAAEACVKRARIQQELIRQKHAKK